TAPQVEVADEALETFPVERRLPFVLRATATLIGLDEETHVVGPAQTRGRHPSNCGCGPARRAWSADGEPTSLIGGLRSSKVAVPVASWLELPDADVPLPSGWGAVAPAAFAASWF